MTTMKHEAATDVATFAPSPSTLVYAWTWLYGLASKNGRIHGQLGCNLG